MRYGEIDPIPRSSSYGPGMYGKGASLNLEEENDDGSSGFKVHLPTSPSQLPSLTVAMWIFLVRTPPPDSISKTNGEEVTSITTHSSIPTRQWVHIAFSLEGKLLELYVNAHKDIQHVLEHKMTIPGKEWLLGGGGPDLSLKSRVSSTKHGRRSVAAYIDRLRFYERTLDREDIAAV
eukprot:jgi/Bigna1/146083/aug1.108_g20791